MDETDCADNAQNAPVNLTRQQAETLLKADLRNLVRKVKDGKTLSARKRNMLQNALSGGSPSTANFAGNQVELTEILGVDRKTIQRHRKIEGNPGVRAVGRYDVAAWRVWLAGLCRRYYGKLGQSLSTSSATLRANDPTVNPSQAICRMRQVNRRSAYDRHLNGRPTLITLLRREDVAHGQRFEIRL